MSKITKALYGATRTIGKIASTANDLEHLGKSIQTGDPSHIINRVARKEINKNSHKVANKLASNINKFLK